MTATAVIWPDAHPPLGDYGGPVLGGWWTAPSDRDGRMTNLPNPWDEGDVVAAAEERVWRACQELAPAIATAVGLHDERWWRWVLLPWLVHVASVVEDCQTFLEQAVAACPGAAVVDFADAVQAPPTMGVGVALLRSPGLHRVLVSRIAGQMGLQLLKAQAPDQAREPAVAQEAAWADGRQDPLAIRLRRRLAALLLESGRSPTAVLGHSGMSGSQALALRRRTRTRILPARVAVPAAPPESTELRERLAGCGTGGDPLTGMVAGLLPIVLPRSVAEGAERLAKSARETYGPPSNVLVGNYGADETMNAHIANCAREHTVDYVQHGGFYMQARTNAQERLEQPRFLSWRQLPSPHLERIRQTHVGGTDVVIVEGLNPPDPYVIRFASTPLANQAYESTDQLDTFAQAARALPLTLRRFPRTGAVRPPALEALPQAPGASAVDAMRTARLVLLAYPDTPFVEAMVLGVPTIGLWNPDHWELRDDAAPAFHALRDEGVLFASPEHAAAQAAEVYSRADQWWASDAVAKARLAFVDRFAPPGDWLSAWSAHLQQRSR